MVLIKICEDVTMLFRIVVDCAWFGWWREDGWTDGLGKKQGNVGWYIARASNRAGYVVGG